MYYNTQSKHLLRCAETKDIIIFRYFGFHIYLCIRFMTTNKLFGMKTGRLRKATSFWKSFFFMGNVCKMRNALMSYLQEEGLKCEIADGEIMFKFNDSHFTTVLTSNGEIGECTICFECEDDEYEKLDQKEKTYMADKVNIDMDNHATVFAYSGSFEVKASFYFTNKEMLINLFSAHFEDLTESVGEALSIVKDQIKIQRQTRGRRIGFNTDSCQMNNNAPDEMQVAAKA